MYSVLYVTYALFFLTVLYATPPRYYTVVICLGAIVFGTIGYGMVPKPFLYVDTIRFFNTLNTSNAIRSVYGLRDSLNYIFNDEGYRSVPIAGIYIFVVSLFNNNRLLNFVTGIIIFIAMMNSLRVANQNKSNIGNVFAGAYLLCVFNFQAAVQGVRTGISYSLFCYTVTAYFMGKLSYRRAVICSLIYSLIHPTILIFLFLFIISISIKSKTASLITSIMLIFNNIFTRLIVELLTIFDNYAYIASIIYKYNQYSGEDGEIYITSDFEIYRSIIKFLFASLLIFIYSQTKKQNNKITENSYMKFLLFNVAFVVGNIFNPLFFSRYVTMLVLLVSPLVVCIFSNFYTNTKEKKESRNMTKIFIIIFACFLVFSLVDNMRAANRFYDISILGGNW